MSVLVVKFFLLWIASLDTIELNFSWKISVKLPSSVLEDILLIANCLSVLKMSVPLSSRPCPMLSMISNTLWSYIWMTFLWNLDIVEIILIICDKFLCLPSIIVFIWTHINDICGKIKTSIRLHRCQLWDPLQSPLDWGYHEFTSALNHSPTSKFPGEGKLFTVFHYQLCWTHQRLYAST